MIKENITRIRQRIQNASVRVNRSDAGDIMLLVVTKGRTPAQIKEVIEAGVRDIGENKIQEALTKCHQLPITDYQLPRIKWHMVGHLQTNKVKDAVRIFDLIHSVDSFNLAQEINKQAARINKIQDILLEVKTSPEETKYGFNLEEVIEAAGEISALENINIKGLMTIAPLADNPGTARPYFRMLRELRDSIYHLPFIIYHLPILSMGMTDDFEVAIEEGSNMVRLGRAVFEDAD